MGRICILTIAIFTVGAVAGIAMQMNLRLNHLQREVEVTQAEMRLLVENQKLQADIDKDLTAILKELVEVTKNGTHKPRR